MAGQFALLSYFSCTAGRWLRDRFAIARLKHLGCTGLHPKPHGLDQAVDLRILCQLDEA